MMYLSVNLKKAVKIVTVLLTAAALTVISASAPLKDSIDNTQQASEELNWVDFNLTEKMMTDALNYDIKSHTEIEEADENAPSVDWVKLLAYLSAKYWGENSRYKKSDMEQAVEKIKNGENIDDLGKDLKLYSFYCTAYNAVLGGMAGDYSYSYTDENGNTVTELKYGLKSFSPVAAGYYYEHYDDFGTSRSYGYQRNHLGHDLLGSTGTPIICVESGTVEELGWNRFGGWRVGIRSLDSKRYYYYAHLQKDHPYPENMKKGDVITAGDVIGYMGRTGYSNNENYNGMTKTHLHWGIQLIFNEAKKDSPSQIWIDLYEITKFLSKHRSQVVPKGGGKDFTPLKKFNDPVIEIYRSTQAETAETKKVPILMYHSVLKSSNGKNDYIVSPDQIEKDLIYIKDNGYQTVTTNDLINFVDGKGKLPEKPVVLTFDDGNYNNYSYVYPLLKKYNMKAIISIVGKYTDTAQELKEDNPSYSSMTWDQVNEVMNSGLVEFQNHSYNLHELKNGYKSIQKRSSESDSQYKKRISDDISKMQREFTENTGYTPSAFTYPFGALGKETGGILKDLGFSASYSCGQGINILTKGDCNGLFLLKRNIRTPKISAESILKKYG